VIYFYVGGFKVVELVN